MASHQSHVVSCPPVSAKSNTRVIAGGLYEAIRTKQWTKNLLIFAGLVFSKNMFSAELMLKSCKAFVFFCVLSSAVYLINDILDVERDRQHPDKASRPIASGRLPIPIALTAAIIFVVFSLAGAFLLDASFGGIALGYFSLMVLYSLYLKRIATVDVLVISVGFIMRAVAGTAVVGVTISQWLIICTTFLALFMALCKRRHELGLLGETGSRHRLALSNYNIRLLDQFIAVASTSAVISYALYTLAPRTIAEFGTTDLVYTVSLVVFAIFRYLYLVYQKNEGGSPEIHLVKDIPLLGIIVCWTILVCYFIYF